MPSARLLRMLARNSALRCALVGIGCLGIGWLVGAKWCGRQDAPLWHEPAPMREVPALPSFAGVVALVMPAVVTVRANLGDPVAATGQIAEDAVRKMAANAPGQRNGSGFIVQAGGLVLTSRHLVLDAESIEVTVPDRGSFVAVLVGEDNATDLALLRLENAPGQLPALAIGDSDTLQAGEWIVAVGNPFGFSQTVSAGIVSFVGRHLPHADFRVTNDFLQISAPVNPGSSGCPVVDLAGRVVGLTTQAPVDAQGISFAVPGSTLKWALTAMQRAADGRVRRGYLGIEFASRPVCDGTRGCGALVVHVVEGQAAHRAGVQAGDIVLSVDGGPVSDARALHRRIVSAAPGTSVALQLLRGGRVHDPIVAVLGEVGTRPNDPAN
jgi:serine protease Do